MTQAQPISEPDIGHLLALFYSRARTDPLLGPVFTRAIGTTDAEWAPHLERIADFWSSLVLGSRRYQGDPFSVHLRLPGLTPAMFERWLALFREACAELLDPAAARQFTERADRIAASLRMGLFERLPARRQAEMNVPGEP
jgi:hemoglobin